MGGHDRRVAKPGSSRPEAARHRKRREVQHMLESEDVGATRQAMEPSQVEALRRGIDRGSKAEFGLVKLAKLDLNVLMQPPSDLAWAGGTMTLLSYAAARNRDAIVGALLRAGADATIRHGCCGAECGSLAARAHLSQLLPMTAAWTVKQVVGLRKAAAAIAGKGSSSGAGYEEAVTVAQQLTCCLCAGPLHAPSALAFPCTHLCCEACLWQHLSHSGRLMCPCNQSSSQLQVWEGDDSAPVEMQQEAVCRKLASKARWALLPEKALRCRALRNTELARPQFKALDSVEVAKIFVGCSRGQRLNNLWRAAVEGNVERLQALVEAGVDVEAENEYGQTALHLVALHGHGRAARLLTCWAAADVECRAYGGSSCCTAAAANGHVEVLKALQTAGADLMAPGAEGKTAWWFAQLCGQQQVLDCLHEWGAQGDYEGSEADGAADLHFQDCGLGGSSGRAGSGAKPAVKVCIPEDDAHPGAGSYTLDACLSPFEVARLKALHLSLTSGQEQRFQQAAISGANVAVTFGDAEAAAEAQSAGSGAAEGTGPQRVYFCDAEGWVRSTLRRLLHRGVAAGLPESALGEALPYCRFLNYRTQGGSMAPHVDLSKRAPGDPAKRASTRTFLLYLDGCGEGGETLLLQREAPTVEAAGLLCAVQPQVGRLLLYPHKCPHAGAPTSQDAPKLLLRGELF